MKAKHIGISGSTGFIGKHLSDSLKKSGVKVVCFSRSQKEGKNSFERHFDMLDELEESVDLRDIGTFIHLAGSAHGKFSKGTGTIEFLALNRLLLNCVSAKINHFVYISSAAVYGKSYSETPISVSSTPTPNSDYGISKLRCENLVKKICMEQGITFSILRLPLVLGSGAPGNLRLLEKIVVSRVPLPFKSLKNKRSVLWLDQFCSFVMTQTHEDKLCNKIIFLCSKASLSTTQIITWIGSIRSTRPNIFGDWGFPDFLKNFSIFGKIIGDLQFFGEECTFHDPGQTCQGISVFLCE